MLRFGAGLEQVAYLSNVRHLWMVIIMLFGLYMLFRRWSWGWLEMVTEKAAFRVTLL